MIFEEELVPALERRDERRDAMLQGLAAPEEDQAHRRRHREGDHHRHEEGERVGARERSEEGTRESLQREDRHDRDHLDQGGVDDRAAHLE